MSKDSVIKISQTAIRWSFLLLFFLVPLIFTPYNYELFEYNKMMLTYGLTAIIVGSFLIKSAAIGKIEIKRTPFDIPLLLFLASQILSTVFSIDRHTSFLGYYSRFHGGLLSTISYISLFYVFVTEFFDNKQFVFTALKTSLISGVLVAFYAVLQRLGIDKTIWVQDVQNRVFSSLGQPNWLAAYFSILILLSLSLFLRDKSYKKLLYLFCLLLFYLVIIFTKSRSGFVGLWTGLLGFAVMTTALPTYLISGFLLEIFSLVTYWKNINLLPSFGKTVNKFFYLLALVNLPFYLFFLRKKAKIGVCEIKKSSKIQLLGITLGLFIIISFIYGTPFSQLEPFTLSGIRQNLQSKTAPKTSSSVPSGSTLEYGGTESGAIRKIVWKGAVDIFKHYPLLGSGVETFAYSYYQFRPQAHNLTSEWDFLYNRAHNEYLNFAATAGIAGLSTYLFMIGFFLFWLRKVILKKPPETLFLAGLGGAYISILVSNFFGFSVVVIGIFFFLIPAFSFVISEEKTKHDNLSISLFQEKKYLQSRQKGSIFFLLFIVIYLLFILIQMWRADKFFNQGRQLINANQPVAAYNLLKKATRLNPGEPFFKDDLSAISAMLALLAKEQKNEELYNQFQEEALNLSSQLVTAYPNNLNFWKTRTKVLYTLSEIDPNYLKLSLAAILKAWELAPNDAKVAYNAGLLYAKVGDNDKAISALEKARILKPDYYEPHWALVIFYEQLGEKVKEKEELNIILTNVRPGDKEAQKKLEELGK